MVDTTEQAELTGRRKGSHGGAIVVAVIMITLLVLAAWKQEELSNYWRLHGWDKGAVRETMEQFVREAHEGQPSAGNLLDPAWAQPKLEGGKLVGVTQSGAHGPTVARVQTFLPEGSIKDCAVRIKNRSGVFQADVQFPNGQWASFDVDRVKGALRIRSVPDRLSPTQPQPQPWD
jgi:hypothetical protein